jgi:23S rRNA (uracil1939-C5)-methyltransferase
VPKVIPNLEITGMDSSGLAYGTTATGQKILVEKAMIGDVCDVQIVQKKKGVSIAKVINFVSKSPERIEPICQHFSICGGCQWQFATYQQQLQWKKTFVELAFKQYGIDQLPIAQVLPSPTIYYYRNKLEFSATSDRWLYESELEQVLAQETVDRNALGYHVPNRWSKIFEVKSCHLQAEPSNAILETVRHLAKQCHMSFYNPVTQQGTLRNLVIRNTSIGELMIIVQFYPSEWEKQELLLQGLVDRFPEITSLYSVANAKGNDTFYDCELKLYFGKEYITEQIGGLKFAITPKSFFQVNSLQAYNLFSVVKDCAQVTGDSIVYDLYSGTGAIAIFLAQSAKQVIGIESVQDAVLDAKSNALINQVHNVHFLAGDMKDIFCQDTIRKYGKPDIVITDPPRSGMHQQVVAQLISTRPQRIVYVSCNPETQARDISSMLKYYQITRMQPVDMFPQTAHVENVVLLERLSDA